MKDRNIGLDLIRCIAVLFVIFVHFFLHSSFYSTNLGGIGGFLLNIFRWLFFICVPLFLLLTGYLNNNTKLDKNYIYKLFKVLISYTIIGIICLVFKKLYLNQDITIIRGIISLFNFSAVDYAWYVEMFVGLFLLIPFLNILYQRLETKENRIKLIVVLFVVCSLTTTFRVFHPARYTLNLFSNYWASAYPLLYFYIGKFLKDYPINMKKTKMFFILIFLLILQSTLVYVNYRNHTDLFFGIDYSNLFTVLISVLLFSIVFKINLKNRIFMKIITLISLVSFEMYLMSFIVDTIVYTELNFSFNSTLDYFKNFVISAPIILFFTFVLSFIVNKFSNLIYKKFRSVYDRICLFISSSFKKVIKK